MRPIGGNITDYASLRRHHRRCRCRDPILHPREGTCRGLRGSAVGWVMSGNAANEVYEDT